jgi:hypothetical protein
VRFVLLVAVLCAGCFSKPGFSERTDARSGDDGATDAPTDAPCERHWQSPQIIPELSGNVTGEPTITGDLKTMMWALQISGSTWEIRWAERASVTAPFTIKPGEPFASMSMFDADPSITDDGLLVVYRSGSLSVPRISQATRPDRNSAWSLAAAPGAPNITVSALDVSGDGLTVYYTDTSNALFSISRPTRSGTFGSSIGPLAAGTTFPAISGDELTVFYVSGTTAISSRIRGTKGAAFPTAGTAVASGYDPDVTADGLTMVVGVGGTGAGLSTFRCDP